MAVDAHWRLYYNDVVGGDAHGRGERRRCSFTRSSHLLRDHEARKKAAASRTTGAGTPPATARSTTISTPRACRCQAIRRCPASMDCRAGETAESLLPDSCRHQPERTDRPAAGDDSSRARLRVGRARRTATLGAAADDEERREARRVSTRSRPRSCGARSRGASMRHLAFSGDVRSAGAAGRTRCSRRRSTTWRRSATRCARRLRDSTLGRYDRTYRRPHRRQACYGEFIMASFYQPRPRPGFLIDTSSSMEDSQLARAVSELAGLTRQLGYGATSSSRAAMRPCTT